MIPLRREILLKALKLFDVVIMSICFAITACIALSRIDIISVNYFLSMRIKARTFIFFLCFVIVWHIVFCIFGLYRSRRLSSRWSEVADVLKATFLGSLILLIMAHLFKIDIVTPHFVVVFWTVEFIIVSVYRSLLRWGLGWIRTRGRNLRHVVILGTNQRAVELARIIETKPWLGFRLKGFVDEVWSGTDKFQKTGYSLVSNYNDFPVFVRKHAVDEVWIVLPFDRFIQSVSRIVDLCQMLGILMKSFSCISNGNVTHLRAEQFEGNPVIAQYSTSIDGGWQFAAKRFMDILFSLILIFLFSPVFLVTAVLILITSPGSIFFVQERIGLNRRRFLLYKFRTMINDAEERQQELDNLNEVCWPVFKIKDDPRITPIGKILRRTSIDELPQLINVLKGDMSLVGPRPLPIKDYKGFYKDRHRRRFSVLPGITCLWQISGRNSVPFEKWMELDLQYIDQWSVWLDLKILLKTVLAVCRISEAA